MRFVDLINIFSSPDLGFDIVFYKFSIHNCWNIYLQVWARCGINWLLVIDLLFILYLMGRFMKSKSFRNLTINITWTIV